MPVIPSHDPVPGSYSVKWASVNHKDEPNVLTITPGFGDGSEERWPPQGPDMSLLGPEHEKQQQWRRTAAEVIAKDLGLLKRSPATAQHWILSELPTGYGLFQQVTQPKESAPRMTGKDKIRHDRFIFGHNSKKIRSAISLGKHISNQIFGAKSLCHCDGCKVTQPKASASSMADIGAPIKMQPRKRKRTGEYANLAGVNTSAPPSMSGLGTAEESEAGGDFDDATSVGTTETADYTFTGGDSAPTSPRKRTISGGGGRGRGRASGPGSENGSMRGRGRGRGRAKRADDDDDYGDDDDGSDYSEEVGSVGPTAPRSTSVRQRRPTSKVLSQIEPNIPTAPGEPAADDYEALMTPAGKDVYRAMGVPTPEEVKEDLADPQASRVGELVWVRVPLGPPPTGELAHAQLSRWPGIVRGRAPAPENPREKVYRVELLGMSSEDTLEGVRSENVTPWLGYIPSNSAYLNANPPEDDGIAAGQPKKRWAAIQEEGWLAVARAFRQAHRIAKAYAAIQARPLPEIEPGIHFTVPDGSSRFTATSTKDLVETGEEDEYLTYDYINYGPEIIHLGDWVRLDPSTKLEPIVTGARKKQPSKALPLSLVMRVGGIYRGKRGAPLIARGLIFEQIETTSMNRSIVDPSMTVLDQATLEFLPPPFPRHKWRFVQPPLDVVSVDVLFSPSVAGRYYPIPPASPTWTHHTVVNSWLDEAMSGNGPAGKGTGAVGGKGEEGIRALSLMLAGLTAGDRTVRIDAVNGINGGRDEQYRIAEEQALDRAAFPPPPQPPVPAAQPAAEPAALPDATPAAKVEDAAAATTSMDVDAQA